VKRRANPNATQTFTDDDLRFRQLARRKQPAVHAVVFFMLDVSGSMSDRDRKLAKSFFFWVVQGLRREYRSMETVFVAHTTEAWEFNEQEFFQVAGTGGTVTSTGLTKVQEIIAERFDPSRYNIYVFYASDGDNYTEDRPYADSALRGLSAVANYMGYLEVSAAAQRGLGTEVGSLFKSLAADGKAVGSFAINRVEDIWNAVKHFFRHESESP